MMTCWQQKPRSVLRFRLAAVNEEEYARLIQKSAEKHEKPDELDGNTHDDDNLNGDKNDEPHCDKTEKMEVSPHHDDSPNGGDKSDEPHCDETEQKESRGNANF
ncbi:hypothetical protein COOONC_06941 [Cooperia oncophora]